MKTILTLTIAAVIGILSTAEAEAGCSDPNFQYSDGYSKQELLNFLNSLVETEEAPCSDISNKEECCACSSENCLAYCRDELYPKNKPKKWSAEIEKRIRAGGDKNGKICPYSMTRYTNRTNVQVEHIVSLAEAHDSGLCMPSRECDRKRFAQDRGNQIMAKAGINQSKRSKDFFEWNLHKGIPLKTKLPKGTKEDNKCWFASRVVQVRAKWGLTIDSDEKEALKDALLKCNKGFTLRLPPENAGSCN